MTKAKKEQTLRQKMRAAAEGRLNDLMRAMQGAAGEVVSDTTIDPVDLMGMCCKSQVGTLREKLVTRLANEAEDDLVALWNNQQDLDLGNKNDNA